MYADYQFYLNEYFHKNAGLIPEAEFPSYSNQASHRIDYLTWGRITEAQADLDAVKLCCCEMSEAIYRYDSARNNDSGAPVSSWSNDGESGSYDIAGSDVTSAGHEAQLSRIARHYLLGLGLLNRRC